jgi:hypothetical protein
MPDHVRLLRNAARASLVAAAVTIMLSSPDATRAQSSQSARDARRIDMEMRQRSLRDLEKLLHKPDAKAPDKRPLYRDVAEDFKQLQLRNYNLSQAAGRGAPLDYALIRAEAAEVKKRAARLRLYLSLPQPDEDRKRDKGEEEATPEGLTSAAASLDALVNSFVWNPVFQRPDVIDLEQSSKASRELEEIIRLSDQIRRRAEGLGKVAAKK